jgi:hypothetical protein
MAEESCHGFAKYWETFLWSKKVWHGFTKKWFKIAEPGRVSLGSQLRMWPRRLKHVAALHLRQIPCFHAVGKPKLNRAEQSHWVWICLDLGFVWLVFMRTIVPFFPPFC